MQKFSTLRVTAEVKKEIDKKKIHPRESYDEVLHRIIFKGDGQ